MLGLIIGSCFILSGCGLVDTPRDVHQYVNQFEAQYGRNAKSVPIDFVNRFSEPDRLAQCDRIDHTIQISKLAWDKSSPIRKKLIVFHELGHCVMGRIHSDKTYPDTCPKSIMSTIMLDDKCYLAHETDLIRELAQ